MFTFLKKPIVWILGLLIPVAFAATLPVNEPAIEAAPTPIIDEMKTKTAKEGAELKATYILATNIVDTYTRNGMTIEVVSADPIDYGLVVYVKAWTGVDKLGFGADGSIETEKINIINPPVKVRDGTTEEIYDAENDWTTITYGTKEDPKEAILQYLFDTVSVVGKKDTKVIIGSIGHTISVINPDAGTGGGGTTTHDGWVEDEATGAGRYSARDDVGNASGDTDSTYDMPRWDERGSGTGFFVRRGQYVFRTAVVGTDNIASATLSIYFNSFTKDNDTLSAGLVSASPANDDAAVAGDYDGFGTTRFATDVRPSVATWMHFNLNASGEAHINKTGNTAFMLMMDGDIDDAGLPPARNVFNTTLADNASNDPKLIIDHSAVAVDVKYAEDALLFNF